MPVVNLQWLIDSIEEWRIMDIQSYTTAPTHSISLIMQPEVPLHPVTGIVVDSADEDDEEEEEEKAQEPRVKERKKSNEEKEIEDVIGVAVEEKEGHREKRAAR